MHAISRLISIVFVMIGLSIGISAQSAPATVQGHLLDAVCAKNHATEVGYKEKHEKSCSLMDVCVKSGFALVTSDNKVLKFDDKGNELALQLIKSTNRDSDWKVTVTGKVSPDLIAVESIKAR